MNGANNRPGFPNGILGEGWKIFACGDVVNISVDGLYGIPGQDRQVSIRHYQFDSNIKKLERTFGLEF